MIIPLNNRRPEVNTSSVMNFGFFVGAKSEDLGEHSIK